MKYVVYTFQFTPLVEVRQLDLFEPTLQVRDEIMAHKCKHPTPILAVCQISVIFVPQISRINTDFLRFSWWFREKNVSFAADCNRKHPTPILAVC